MLTLLGAACGTNADAPSWYTGRADMPSCGEFALDYTGDRNAELEDGFACLAEAFPTGDSAELTLTRPTLEGGQITDTYQVTGERQIAKYADHRGDRLRSFDFTFAICTDIPESGMPDRCEPVDDREVPRR